MSFEANRRILPPGTLGEKGSPQCPQHRRRHAVGAEPDHAALSGSPLDIEPTDTIVGIRLRTVDQSRPVASNDRASLRGEMDTVDKE